MLIFLLVVFVVITQIEIKTGEGRNCAPHGWEAMKVGGRYGRRREAVQSTYHCSPSENFYQQIKQGGTTPRTRYGYTNLQHLSTFAC